MQWIRENWFWLIVSVAFAWMHLKMHGGHGRHGAHGTRSAHTPNGGDSDHAEH